MILLAAAALAAAALGLALYLMNAAHGVRREADRTLQRVLAEQAVERREWADDRTMLLDRLASAAGQPYLETNGKPRELVISDPWGPVDPNVDGFLSEPPADQEAAS